MAEVLLVLQRYKTPRYDTEACSNGAPTEFWANRVAATNLQPTQTRIPERPDQTDFLRKWYDFHRGYRIQNREDGTEERIAVLGEPFEDVSPGLLPRTLDQLRTGANRDLVDEVENVDISTALPGGGLSLDETLDDLFNTVSEEEAQASSSHESRRTEGERVHGILVAGQVMNARAARVENREDARRRIELAKRDLDRVEGALSRIIAALEDFDDPSLEGGAASVRIHSLVLTILGMVRSRLDFCEDVVTEESSTADLALEDAQRRLADADVALRLAERRSSAADQYHAELQTYLNLVQAEEAAANDTNHLLRTDLRIRRRDRDRIGRETQVMENYRRVFGSREEMERDDYVSPLTGMFNRMYARYNDAERTRQEQDALRQVLASEESAEDHDAMRSIWDTIPNRPAGADFPRNMLAQRYDTLANGQDGQQIFPWPHAPPRDGPSWNVPTDFPLNPQNDPVIRDIPPPRLNGESHAHPATPSDRMLPADLDRPPQRPSRRLLRFDNRERRETHDTDEARRLVSEQTERYMAHVRDQIGRHDLPQARPNPFPPPPRLMHQTLDFADDPPSPQGLDVDSDRPDPRDTEEMTFSMDCKICYTQIADIACQPCGHLVMCNWCSQQHGKTSEQDRTRPVGLEKCPVCRKRVKQKVKVRFG